MDVKEELQNLINQINSETELESYLNLIKMLSSDKQGQLISRLTTDQKAELDLAYDESLNSSNLISHEAIKAKFNEFEVRETVERET